MKKKNGAEAVEKVNNSKPGNYDLVLMDVEELIDAIPLFFVQKMQ